MCFTATPKAPTSLNIKNVEATTVTLQWKPPKDDGGSKIVGYTVRRQEEGSEVWEDVGTLKSFETEFTAKNLKTGTAYNFAVVAENKLGLGDAVNTDSPVIPRRKPGELSWKQGLLLTKLSY